MADTKPEITAEGVSVQTFDEIYSEYETGYKGIYGDDIDLNQNTPDGQRIGIDAKMVLDLQSFGLSVYNGLDPDLATGDQLNRIVKFCGIRRKPPTRSSAPAIIVANFALTLKAGYIVQDANGENWITVSDYNLISGENAVTLYAQKWGKIDAPANTITSPVTIILGVRSVTNTAAATAGTEEETDEELRARRNRSIKNPSYSTTGGLYAKLANLSGITDLVIYENDTAEYDEGLELGAHSLWVIIDGGDNADITETIARNKTGGTPLKGDISGAWIEIFTRPDGSLFYYTHTAKWDVSIKTPLFVRVNVTRKNPSMAIDTGAIKNAIAAATFNIGESITVTGFYCNIYNAGSNFFASELEFSRDGVSWHDDIISAANAERFNIPVENITVEEI